MLGKPLWAWKSWPIFADQYLQRYTFAVMKQVQYLMQHVIFKKDKQRTFLLPAPAYEG